MTLPSPSSASSLSVHPRNTTLQGHHRNLSSYTSSTYLQKWRKVPGGLAFLLPLLPLVVVSSVLTWVGLAVGIGLTIVWVGIPILLGTLLLSRFFGRLELQRLAAAGYALIPAPNWAADRAHKGIWRRCKSIFADSRTWTYWFHTSVINLFVGTVTWAVGVAWTALALGGTTYWLWAGYVPRDERDLWLHTVVLQSIPGYAPATDGSDLFMGESIFYAFVGLLCLASLPIVIYRMVALHHQIAEITLGER